MREYLIVYGIVIIIIIVCVLIADYLKDRMEEKRLAKSFIPFFYNKIEDSEFDDFTDKSNKFKENLIWEDLTDSNKKIKGSE